MSPMRVDEVASASECVSPGDGGRRTFFKALLLMSTLLSGGLLADPADAGEMLVTTTGTITSGTETGGLFGLGASASLVGFNYTLEVYFGSLGPNYTTNGTGGFASDTEMPGVGSYVKAIVNGVSLAVSVANSFMTSLHEDRYDLDAASLGTDASGNYVNVAQSLACSSTSACVPYADLLTPFLHALGPSDFAADTYTYEGAGFPGPAPTANFSGSPTSVDFQVPEPASWALLASELLGIAMLARRRRA
jgi:hypothetical protein